jgi:hypothetical protein
MRAPMYLGGRPIYRLAQWWVTSVAFVTSTVFVTGILALLGLNTPAPVVPLFVIVRQYPVTSMTVLGVLAAVTVLSAVAHGDAKGGSKRHPAPGGGGAAPRYVISTVIATVSTVVLVMLLATVLVRPAWCPTAICPAAGVLTNPHGIHDKNLEIYVTALQSAYFVIPGEPAQYSQRNLPESIGAVRIDDPHAPSYRIVVGVHSLQQGRFGIVIEQIALVVQQALDVPPKLDVWLAGSPQDYRTNPFLVVFSGQQPGTVLSATYLPFSALYVQLAPGEADELDLQVVSHMAVDLRFRVQVTYRVTNEPQVYSLLLPQSYEMVFSDMSNWHLYHLQNGQFVASS